MTVKELRKLLDGIDGDRIVVVSRDEEGNGFNELHQVDAKSVFIRDDSEIYMERNELTDELRRNGYSEEDTRTAEDGELCIVLWP